MLRTSAVGRRSLLSPPPVFAFPPQTTIQHIRAELSKWNLPFSNLTNSELLQQLLFSWQQCKAVTDFYRKAGSLHTNAEAIIYDSLRFDGPFFACIVIQPANFYRSLIYLSLQILKKSNLRLNFDSTKTIPHDEFHDGAKEYGRKAHRYA